MQVQSFTLHEWPRAGAESKPWYAPADRGLLPPPAALQEFFFPKLGELRAAVDTMQHTITANAMSVDKSACNFIEVLEYAACRLPERLAIAMGTIAPGEPDHPIFVHIKARLAAAGLTEQWDTFMHAHHKVSYENLQRNVDAYSYLTDLEQRAMLDAMQKKSHINVTFATATAPPAPATPPPELPQSYFYNNMPLAREAFAFLKQMSNISQPSLIWLNWHAGASATHMSMQMFNLQRGSSDINWTSMVRTKDAQKAFLTVSNCKVFHKILPLMLLLDSFLSQGLPPFTIAVRIDAVHKQLTTVRKLAASAFAKDVCYFTLRPSTHGSEKLADKGLTTDMVRAVFAEKGLPIP